MRMYFAYEETEGVSGSFAMEWNAIQANMCFAIREERNECMERHSCTVQYMQFPNACILGTVDNNWGAFLFDSTTIN